MYACAIETDKIWMIKVYDTTIFKSTQNIHSIYPQLKHSLEKSKFANTSTCDVHEISSLKKEQIKYVTSIHF